eukprot:scaffold13603_cov112-Isochrysis_galbana.AAC.3
MVAHRPGQLAEEGGVQLWRRPCVLHPQDGLDRRAALRLVALQGQLVYVEDVQHRIGRVQHMGGPHAAGEPAGAEAVGFRGELREGARNRQTEPFAVGRLGRASGAKGAPAQPTVRRQWSQRPSPGGRSGLTLRRGRRWSARCTRQ